MANAPLVQDAQTPWAGYTFGRLVELALREIGLSWSGHASPDTTLPTASAEEVATVKDLVREALVFLQGERERYWSLSYAEIAADILSGGTTYPSVLLPADFEISPRNAYKVSGCGVMVITPEQFLETRRPDSQGGGTILTGTSGDRPDVLVIQPAKQAAAADVWRLAAWGYPVQDATWTLQMVYRATAKNLSGDTDAIRLPTRLQAQVFRFVTARWRELTGDPRGALERWNLFDFWMNKIENVPPSEEQDLALMQGYSVGRSVP